LRGFKGVQFETVRSATSEPTRVAKLQRRAVETVRSATSKPKRL
jgi:hypothetical protein